MKSFIMKIGAAVMFAASGLVYAFMPGNDTGIREFAVHSVSEEGTRENEVRGNGTQEEIREDGAREDEAQTVDGNPAQKCYDDNEPGSDGISDSNNRQNSADAGDDLSDTRIDINSADAVLLDTLPGIGPAKAEAILAYRQEHGPFEKPEDLMNVPGIKNGTYDKLKDLICCR
ncbi:MAG: helix-hairpin-helix domain-containing protein [Lachnospiraceae bacterium]|nr:helix-hairpin-helix domain-containing protein [Lachnospiraceae bacterium]